MAEKEKKGFFAKLFGGLVSLVTFRWLFKRKDEEGLTEDPKVTPISQEELDEAQENENDTSSSEKEETEESEKDDEKEDDKDSSNEKDDEKEEEEEEGYEMQ